MQTTDSDAGELLPSITTDDQADVMSLNTESQRRVAELETLFELAPVGLAIARDRECLHIEPNPAMRRMLRLPLDANASRSAPVEQRPANFRVLQDGVEVAPEDLPMQRVARTGLPINGSECQIEFDDGSVIYLLGSSTPLFDEQNKPRGCIGAFLDITDRKKAAEAIKDRERYVRGMLDALPEHVAVLNQDGVIEAVNSPWCRFAEDNGTTAAAVSVGANYLAVCRQAAASGDQSAGEVVGLLEELLAGQRDEFSLEYPCHAPTETRWFVVRARKSEGTPRGVVITHIDITARRMAEDATKESEARLAAALEAGRMGLWEWDLLTNTSVWNATEYRLLGLPVGCGREPSSRFVEHVHPEDAEPFENAISEAMENHSEFYHELRVRHANGEERWLAAAGQFQRDASGKPLKMIGVNYDITDRKLADARLLEARAEGEAASRAKDRFMAILSHELRGPLSPVMAAMAYWERYGSGLPADLREDIGMIVRNLNLQTRLIDDLLDINRIANGKLSILPELIDLHELLNRCMESNRAAMEAKGLTGGCSLRALRTNITADQARLEQVFGNILRNAVKFTANGSIEIVTEDLSDVEPGFIRVQIRDTGAGLGAGVSPESIFEPFEQGGTDRTRQYGGLGLGLAICRGLVEAHGGRVFAASDGPGKGTTITVELLANPTGGTTSQASVVV